MIARLGAATAAALLLVACGGDDGGRWDAEVAATRDALEAGDRDAALASLEEIDADARRAHAEGEVSDEELYELTSDPGEQKNLVSDPGLEAVKPAVRSRAAARWPKDP